MAKCNDSRSLRHSCDARGKPRGDAYIYVIYIEFAESSNISYNRGISEMLFFLKIVLKYF